jgi:hypothetical protein
MAAREPSRKPIESTTDSQLDKAIAAVNADQDHTSEASKHVDNFKNGGKGDPNKVLKLVGGVVAVVAAVAVGSYAVKQSKSRKEKAEDDTKGLLDTAGDKLVGGKRWFGQKAEAAKDKAGNVADDISPQIKNIAGATKDKLGDATHGVTSAAAAVKDRANIAGVKAEKEGLKASEASDHAVRDAADKVIHKGKHAKGEVENRNFFDNLKGWFADRKDNVEDAASAVKDKTGEAVQKVKK